jgi:hypothetical protein
MLSIQQEMNDFRRQLKAGSIQKAYRALLGSIGNLRTHFKNSHPAYSVSGLYQGYMDMTYFAIVPLSLKQHGLKVAIVFNYQAFRFEAWLAGINRQVQQKYWEMFRNSQWIEYRVVTPEKGVDSIIECNLTEDFWFNDLDSLTATIDRKAVEFIDNVERYLVTQGVS